MNIKHWQVTSVSDLGGSESKWTRKDLYSGEPWYPEINLTLSYLANDMGFLQFIYLRFNIVTLFLHYFYTIFTHLAIWSKGTFELLVQRATDWGTGGPNETSTKIISFTNLLTFVDNWNQSCKENTKVVFLMCIWCFPGKSSTFPCAVNDSYHFHYTRFTLLCGSWWNDTRLLKIIWLLWWSI